MTFIKGQSGNPRGRPVKANAFAEVLRLLLDEERAGKTTREQIARVVIDKAISGDMDAIKWIVDRTDGKVTDTLSALIDSGVSAPLISDDTINAALDYYAAKRRLGQDVA